MDNNSLNFTVVNNTVLESIYSGFYIFNVPEYITAIYDKAFSPSRQTLTTINFLGDKVVSIGNDCMAHCTKLVNMNLSQCPNLEFVGSFAFVAIATPTFYFPPKSLISRGGYQLSLISEFIVPENHIQYISEDGIVYSKDKTIIYAYPPKKQGDNFSVPNQVQILNDLSFVSTIFKYITFPRDLHVIKEYTFALSSLIEVIIPETVQSVEIRAFEQCKDLRLVQFHCSINNIPSHMFWKCISLHTIIIIGNPAIEDNVFKECSSLCKIYSTEYVLKQIMRETSLQRCHTKQCQKCVPSTSLFHSVLSFIFISILSY